MEIDRGSFHTKQSYVRPPNVSWMGNCSQTWFSNKNTTWYSRSFSAVAPWNLDCINQSFCFKIFKIWYRKFDTENKYTNGNLQELMNFISLCIPFTTLFPLYLILEALISFYLFSAPFCPCHSPINLSFLCPPYNYYLFTSFTSYLSLHWELKGEFLWYIILLSSTLSSQSATLWHRLDRESD